METQHTEFERKIGDLTVSLPHDKFMPAYHAALTEMENAAKNSKNPHFNSRYSDLADCMDVIKPVLTKHGLAMSQVPTVSEDNKTVTMMTLLIHSSGQYAFSRLTIQSADTKAQSIGSTITYARRYALPIVGLITEIDDDGNSASGRTTPPTTTKPKTEQKETKQSQPEPAANKPEGKPVAPSADAFDAIAKDSELSDLFYKAAEAQNFTKNMAAYQQFLVKAGIPSLHPKLIKSFFEGLISDKNWIKVIQNFAKVKGMTLERAIEEASQSGANQWLLANKLVAAA